MTCTYCLENGHYRSTCIQRKRNEAIWKYQRALLKSGKKDDVKELALNTVKQIKELNSDPFTVIIA
jgi:hypothetical protein